jgi:hypothetical protein
MRALEVLAIWSARMSPKYAIYNPLTQRYLSWTKLGPVWMEQWKHATKWPSQYKAKLFIEDNKLFGVVAIQVLPKKVDVSVPQPSLEEV